MAVPNRAFLRASLALWKRRERYRKSRHDHWQRQVDRARAAGLHPRQDLIDKRNHWTRLLKQARARVMRRERQLGFRVKARGVDVSNNNGRVDFEQIREAGYRFVWLKASEGTGFTDAFFLDNVKRARKAGLKVGAYHFLSAANAAAQAEHFVTLIRQADLGKGDLLPVVDVEKAGVSTTLAGQFIGEIRHSLGVFPLIYTFPSFADWPSDFGCKLWIANFGVRKPSLPGPWQSYAAWQFSSSATVPGVSGDCDVNVTPSLAGITW